MKKGEKKPGKDHKDTEPGAAGVVTTARFPRGAKATGGGHTAGAATFSGVMWPLSAGVKDPGKRYLVPFALLVLSTTPGLLDEVHKSWKARKPGSDHTAQLPMHRGR